MRQSWSNPGLSELADLGTVVFIVLFKQDFCAPGRSAMKEDRGLARMRACHSQKKGSCQQLSPLTIICHSLEMNR